MKAGELIKILSKYNGESEVLIGPDGFPIDSIWANHWCAGSERGYEQRKRDGIPPFLAPGAPDGMNKHVVAVLCPGPEKFIPVQ